MEDGRWLEIIGDCAFYERLFRNAEIKTVFLSYILDEPYLKKREFLILHRAGVQTFQVWFASGITTPDTIKFQATQIMELPTVKIPDEEISDYKIRLKTSRSVRAAYNFAEYWLKF